MSNIASTSASLFGSTTKKQKLDTVPMHWSARLDALIKTIEPLGSFVHQETLQNMPHMLPRVSVDGIGRLGFPMPDVVINALIAESTKASYGHSEKTLIDTKGRDAWQIDATQVSIGTSGDDAWTTYFTETVQQHCFHLGISKKRFEDMGIQAKLCKMLINEEGGHFLSHRDTEKEAHMFGTLILQLPTSEGYEGGELTVSHNDATKTFDLSVGSDNEFLTASFYTDCHHKLHPVTRGKRVCLVYNLVAASVEKPSIPSHDINAETEQKLCLIVDDWKRSGDLQIITKIGYQLEHKYTHESIGFSTLKGLDKSVAATLRKARDPSGTRLFRISLLVMEHYHKSYNNDDETEWYTPTKVIDETPAGSFEEILLKRSQGSCGNEKVDVGSGKWDFLCHSRNGWWVTPEVYRKDVITEKEYYIKENRKKIDNHDNGNNDLGNGDDAVERKRNDGKGDDDDDDNDDVEKEEEDDDDDDDGDYSDDDENDDDGYDEGVVFDDDGVELDSDRQMFLSTCDVIKKENACIGNDSGSHETWCYAAAIIISPSNFFL